MIFQLECKNYIKSTLIAAIVIGMMLLMVIFMFPMMQEQMSGMISMIESLGMFTQALKIDSKMISELLGFYSMEMENMLGIGGAFFAGYLGIKMIVKEENNHTAEFLLTHPVSRLSVYGQKSLAVTTMIIIFNIGAVACAWLGIVLSNQPVNLGDFIVLHLVTMCVHLLIAWACIGMSAFLRQEMIGLGLGFVFILYILNIMINLSDQISFLKWITPFQFAYAADVLGGAFNMPVFISTTIISLIIWCLGGIYYYRKDIHS